jgi:hypothetical protein
MTTNRYVTVALILPMLLLVYGLHAIIHWRPWLEKFFAVAIAVFATCVSFIQEDRSINYNNISADIPYLKAVIGHNHIQDCLSNYWSANVTTFLSNGEVSPRSLTSDGRIYYWFNSLEWFGKGHPYEQWPHFRMIYLPDHSYSDRFGPPDRIVYAPGGSEIWLYSDARSIRYSEYFDYLSNKFSDEGRTVEIDASSLQSIVGQVQGHSRIVVDGKDHDGWMVFGPYLELEPGRYRATYHYTYLLPPAKDNPPTYDRCVHTGEHEDSFDSQPLPCPDTTPQILTDEFTVTKPKQQYEMRVYYHNSGTLRVDSLELTYLGR